MCRRRRVEVVKTRLHHGRGHPLSSSLLSHFGSFSLGRARPPRIVQAPVSQRRRLRRPWRPRSLVKLPHETFLMSNGGRLPSLFAVSALPLPPPSTSATLRRFFAFTTVSPSHPRIAVSPAGEPFPRLSFFHSFVHFLFIPQRRPPSLPSCPPLTPPPPATVHGHPYLSISSSYRGVFSKGRHLSLLFSAGRSSRPNDRAGRRGAIARADASNAGLRAAATAINARIMLNIAGYLAAPRRAASILAGPPVFPGRAIAPLPSRRTAAGTRGGNGRMPAVVTLMAPDTTRGATPWKMHRDLTVATPLAGRCCNSGDAVQQVFGIVLFQWGGLSTEISVLLDRCERKAC